MRFKKGKLYTNSNSEFTHKDYHLVILCTENSDTNLEGVVVSAKNKFTDHKIGTYSRTWTPILFGECDESHCNVILHNSGWFEEDYKELVVCQG